MKRAAIERDYLTVNDFETDIAASGPDGIRMGRMGRYDLILLDLMLPGMDGFDVCRRLRETLDIPILGRLYHQALFSQCAGGQD